MYMKVVLPDVRQNEAVDRHDHEIPEKRGRASSKRINIWNEKRQTKYVYGWGKIVECVYGIKKRQL